VREKSGERYKHLMVGGKLKFQVREIKLETLGVAVAIVTGVMRRGFLDKREEGREKKIMKKNLTTQVTQQGKNVTNKATKKGKRFDRIGWRCPTTGISFSNTSSSFVAWQQ
jgi:hypothetical protein